MVSNHASRLEVVLRLLRVALVSGGPAMRNMSFMLTPDQILAQTKTVTRRIGWRNLLVGTSIQPVRKGMGLKAGEKVERLGVPVRITNVRRELLSRMSEDIEYGMEECKREGFGEHPVYAWPSGFIEMFCSTHRCGPDSLVTRIEFEYLPPSIGGDQR